MQIWIVVLYFVGGLQIGVTSSSNNANSYSKSECTKWSPPKIDLEKLRILEDFYPFRFRTNKHGSKKYKLKSTHQNHPILNIKAENTLEGDTLKGGNLDGPYYFFRSFFVTQKDLIHIIGKESFDLEIWNVYIRNSNSSIPSNPSFNVLSMNLLFKVNNSMNNESPHLQPVFTAAKNLHEKNAGASLPFNFDPHNLLPHKTDFISYESKDQLPFPYPKSISNAEESHFIKTESRSRCSAENRNFNPVKIFVSLKPLPVSVAQLEMFTSVESNILIEEKLTPRNKNIDFNINTHGATTYNSTSAKFPDYGEVLDSYYLIPNQFQVIFGRPHSRIRSRFRRSASIIDVKKNFEGKPEIDPYPSECKFLENLHEIMKRKGSHSSATLLLANKMWMRNTMKFFLSSFLHKFMIVVPAAFCYAFS